MGFGPFMGVGSGGGVLLMLWCFAWVVILFYFILFYIVGFFNVILI